MRIVTDGELYAIEKGWLWWKSYKDLSLSGYRYWWYPYNRHFNDCWTTLDRCHKFMDDNKKRKIRPVDV